MTKLYEKVHETNPSLSLKINNYRASISELITTNNSGSNPTDLDAKKALVEQVFQDNPLAAAIAYALVVQQELRNTPTNPKESRYESAALLNSTLFDGALSTSLLHVYNEYAKDSLRRYTDFHNTSPEAYFKAARVLRYDLKSIKLPFQYSDANETLREHIIANYQQLFDLQNTLTKEGNALLYHQLLERIVPTNPSLKTKVQEIQGLSQTAEQLEALESLDKQVSDENVKQLISQARRLKKIEQLGQELTLTQSEVGKSAKLKELVNLSRRGFMEMNNKMMKGQLREWLLTDHELGLLSQLIDSTQRGKQLSKWLEQPDTLKLVVYLTQYVFALQTLDQLHHQQSQPTIPQQPTRQPSHGTDNLAYLPDENVLLELHNQAKASLGTTNERRGYAVTAF